MTKVNILSSIDNQTNKMIVDYQAAYQKRFNSKISKSDAIAQILNLGFNSVQIQIEKWDKEVEQFLKP